MRVLILNGPNLNLLGKREPSIYGTTTMQEVITALQQEYPQTELRYDQYNSEGEFINRLQQNDYDALILNPGAFTHYSYALADALRNIDVPKVEVHLTNLYKREEFRHKSVTAPYCDGLISGFGTRGYRLALEYLK